MRVSITSKYWSNLMSKLNIFRFSAIVTVLAACFPIVLLISQFHLSWLYIAYLLYGSMQAGSELSWNLSGPVFAKHEDSSIYSSVNVACVGIRGCLAPLIGSLLCAHFSSFMVLALSFILCSMATYQMARCARYFVSHNPSGQHPQKKELI